MRNKLTFLFSLGLVLFQIFTYWKIYFPIGENLSMNVLCILILFSPIFLLLFTCILPTRNKIKTCVILFSFSLIYVSFQLICNLIFLSNVNNLMIHHFCRVCSKPLFGFNYFFAPEVSVIIGILLLSPLIVGLICSLNMKKKINLVSNDTSIILLLIVGNILLYFLTIIFLPPKLLLYIGNIPFIVAHLYFLLNMLKYSYASQINVYLYIFGLVYLAIQFISTVIFMQTEILFFKILSNPVLSWEFHGYYYKIFVGICLLITMIIGFVLSLSTRRKKS